MEIAICLIIALTAYLLGSIPAGYLAGKARGVDIRQVGSGNIGATNAFRILGKTAGTIVLIADAFKGWLAAAVVPGLVIQLFFAASGGGSSLNVEYLKIVAGIAVILGHNYPCWLKFKGGKGIATTAGVYLALAPWAVLVGLVVFILAVLFTKYVSVGSIAAAIALPVTVWIMTPQNIFLGIVSTALGALAIYKHKSNIQRLRAGTEHKLGSKPVTAK